MLFQAAKFGVICYAAIDAQALLMILLHTYILSTTGIPKLLSNSKILEFRGQYWVLKTKQEMAPYPCTKQKDIGLWSTGLGPDH